MQAAEKESNLPDEVIYDITSLGDGLKLRSRRTVELTIEQAAAVLELPEFVGERAFVNNHAVFLARQMEAGTFRWEQVNLATCFCDGREYRMNGHHTCWARVEAQLPKGTRTPVGWLRYEAASDQDMRQLYATFDRGKPRTMQDVVVSYIDGRAEFEGYDRLTMRQLAQGLAFWLWEDSHTRKLHSGDERAYLMLKDRHKVTMEVGGFIRAAGRKDYKHLSRMPVYAAMFATYNKAPQVAKEFWVVVRDGVGVTDKQDPRHVLRNYLMTTCLSVDKSSDQKSISGETMYRACVYCWNLYRAGKTIKNIRPGNTEARPEAK